MSSEVFFALADPTRRQIIEILAERGSGTATALASELDITRQAVAKHLALLAAAGLASGKKVGRETRFAPQPEALTEVIDWVAKVEGEWKSRLSQLAETAVNNSTIQQPPAAQ
ncbi:MAG: metalloregulator ArsR/SmtB family transcription factor [Acidimicrobiales bacterium]